MLAYNGINGENLLETYTDFVDLGFSLTFDQSGSTVQKIKIYQNGYCSVFRDSLLFSVFYINSIDRSEGKVWYRRLTEKSELDLISEHINRAVKFTKSTGHFSAQNAFVITWDSVKESQANNYTQNTFQMVFVVDSRRTFLVLNYDQCDSIADEVKLPIDKNGTYLNWDGSVSSTRFPQFSNFACKESNVNRPGQFIHLLYEKSITLLNTSLLYLKL